MKLRFPVHLQQLLFAGGCVFALLATAHGQQDADVFIGGQAQRVKVMGVAGTTLMVRSEFGERGIPLAQVTEVRMAAPAEFAQAFQAYQAKDNAKALTLVRAVTDRFRGLPTSWAQQASALLVEILLAMGDTARAEADYSAFQRAYPTGGSMQVEVLAARIAVAKKNFAAAKSKIERVTDAALKEKAPNPANALAYSQAFLISGQVKESEGQFVDALEDYLRTVTVFYHDRSAVMLAQERADALRAKHPEVTVR